MNDRELLVSLLLYDNLAGQRGVAWRQSWPISTEAAATGRMVRVAGGGGVGMTRASYYHGRTSDYNGTETQRHWSCGKVYISPERTTTTGQITTR